MYLGYKTAEDMRGEMANEAAIIAIEAPIGRTMVTLFAATSSAVAGPRNGGRA